MRRRVTKKKHKNLPELLNIRVNEHSKHNYFVSPLA